MLVGGGPSAFTQRQNEFVQASTAVLHKVSPQLQQLPQINKADHSKLLAEAQGNVLKYKQELSRIVTKRGELIVSVFEKAQ